VKRLRRCWAGFIEVIFFVAVAGALSCGSGGGRGGASPQSAADQTAVFRLTTGTPAADEQARAAAYAEEAAVYARIAAANRAAAGTASKLAPTTAASAATPRQADREQAAAVADRLGANAQRAADFHSSKAAELSDGAPKGGGK